MNGRQWGVVVLVALLFLGLGYLIWGYGLFDVQSQEVAQSSDQYAQLEERVAELEQYDSNTDHDAPTDVPEQGSAVSEAEEDTSSEAEVVVPPNDLESPVLHHADSHAPEEGYGSFDVGVNEGQIGLAFGVHILWPQGELDAGGDGCDLVILNTGWYENLQILDGRYEVYDVPSQDYSGWVEVLGQQRADEQAANYSCPGKDFEGIPQWDSPHSSPPQ